MSQAPPSRFSQPVRRALAISGLVLLVCAGAGAPVQPGSPGPVVPVPGSVSTGRASLMQAGGHIDSALRWLERRAEAGADELDRLVREHRPEQLLADAAARVQERLGLFEYRPGDTGESWQRFEQGPSEAPEGRIVVLIHGLDEPGDVWDELAPALARDGHRVLRFNYPNDQSPSKSADLLSGAFENELDPAGIGTVSIVAHSMGGLIARDLLTRHASAEDWAGPEISHLITVGTPNQGSPMAVLQPLGEAREVIARVWASRSLDAAEILSFLVDGSGDAATALASGSDYLRDLNARPLPDGTVITIIGAHATEAQRQRIDDLAASAPVADLLGETARALLLSRIDAMTDLLGDGVVPLSSTPLEGVEDYQLISANHRSALRTIPLLSIDEVPPAIPIILDRLSQPGEPKPASDEADSP